MKRKIHTYKTNPPPHPQQLQLQLQTHLLSSATHATTTPDTHDPPMPQDLVDFSRNSTL